MSPMMGQDHPGPFLTSPTLWGQPSDLYSLPLRFTGSPTPVIHWSKLRSPLPWQHRLEGDTLIIPRVAQQDSGQYICNATSPVGHAEATIALHVESKELTYFPWATLSAPHGGLSPPPGCTLDRTPGPHPEGQYLRPLEPTPA